MPDTIRSLFSCQRRFLRGAKPRTRRSEAQETALVIDDTEIAAAEARDGAPVVVLGKADELAGQRLADEHFLALPFDRPAGAHAPHLVLGVIPRIVKARWQGAGRWPPIRCRRDLIERFMRPFAIVVLAEAVEARLLLERAGGGRSGGLRLQRAMHALVPAVVLRARGPDVARLDAKLEPPDRQRRQAARPGRAERSAVVGANGRRPSHLRHGMLQPRLDLLRTEMRKPPPCRDNALDELASRCMRTVHRRVAALLEPSLLAALAAPSPDVKRVPANPISPAQIRNGESAGLVFPHQRDTLFHRTGLLERHRPILLRIRRSLTCQESTRSKLSGLSPVCTGSFPLPQPSPASGPVKKLASQAWCSLLRPLPLRERATR